MTMKDHGVIFIIDPQNHHPRGRLRIGMLAGWLEIGISGLLRRKPQEIGIEMVQQKDEVDHTGDWRIDSRFRSRL